MEEEEEEKKEEEEEEEVDVYIPFNVQHELTEVWKDDKEINVLFSRKDEGDEGDEGDEQILKKIKSLFVKEGEMDIEIEEDEDDGEDGEGVDDNDLLNDYEEISEEVVGKVASCLEKLEK